jgi:hypothetical protein
MNRQHIASELLKAAQEVSGMTAKRKNKKKPLNQERRMKQMLEKEPEKTRGKMPPPSRGHKDKRREKRQDTKRNLRDQTR